MLVALSPALLSRCWFLAGPTASGKTAVSVELSGRLNAEVVALDSMSLYRGMDVGTAKPDRATRERVPHHLIDILEPHEEYSLAEYLQAAEQCCQAIVDRGRVPLFVGGTGLYLRTVLRGLFVGPAANWELRHAWEEEARVHGAEALHAKLAAVDAVTAARLHPNDVRRVIRALEVYEITGRTLSEQQQEGPRPERPQNVYWLEPDRACLHVRIETRVRQMLDEGWLDEVRKLAAATQPLSRTAGQAVGYRELLEYLAGRLSYEVAVRQTVEHTRQFAKRQYTWFRNLEECTAVPVTAKDTPAMIADRILLQSQQSRVVPADGPLA